MNETIKQILKEKFDAACNQYVEALYSLWHISRFDGFWVAGDVGGVYVFQDDVCLSMEEVIYCVDNDVEMETIEEWNEYACKAIEFGFPTMSLRSWCSGCPRVSEDVFERLYEKKRELERMCDEEKQRIENEQQDS